MHFCLKWHFCSNYVKLRNFVANCREPLKYSILIPRFYPALWYNILKIYDRVQWMWCKLMQCGGLWLPEQLPLQIWLLFPLTSSDCYKCLQTNLRLIRFQIRSIHGPRSFSLLTTSIFALYVDWNMFTCTMSMCLQWVEGIDQNQRWGGYVTSDCQV